MSFREVYIITVIMYMIISGVATENCIGEEWHNANKHDRCPQWSGPGTCQHSVPCILFFKIGQCASCDNSTCSLSIGSCFLDLDLRESYIGGPDFTDGYYKVKVASCQQLNQDICGKMNREGTLCSKCNPGYGPSLYSSTAKCIRCDHDNAAWLWLVYVAMELVPPTVFYLLVIIFNVQTTSPPFTAIVFFSQLFGYLYKIDVYFRLVLKTHVDGTILNVALTLIDVWNLDFFRHVFQPFCVSSELTDLHAMFFEYISALYPLLLITVTFIAIELHARNFRLLVVLWRPFHKCVAKCRRNLDPKASLITGFATFLCLSASKLLFTSFVIEFPALSELYYGTNSTSVTHKLLYDPQVQANSTAEFSKRMASTSYFMPVLIVFVLVQLPTFLLLFYPVRIFRKLISYCGRSKYQTFYIFVDTFQGHYKDGTAGTFDYRAVSSTSFLLRSLLGLYFYSYSKRLGLPIYKSFLPTVTLLGVSLFYGLVQPCKKRYMNVMECLLYCGAALLFLSIGSGSHSRHRSTITLILIMLASLFILFAVVARVMKACIGRKRILSVVVKICPKLSRKCGFVDHSETSPEAEEPDRLRNPLNYMYEPLP